MNEKEYGTVYMDLSDDYFKMSNIISHEGHSYFVDTSYAADVQCLETAVFKLKKVVPDGYNPFENPEEFENNVDWENDLYMKRHKDKSEARRIHVQVCHSLKETGSVNNALN